MSFLLWWELHLLRSRGLMYKGYVCTKKWRTHFFTSTIRCIKSEMNVEMCSASRQLQCCRTHFSTAIDSLATLRGDVGKLLYRAGASCTKTCVEFLLKHGVRSNQNAFQRTKISGCINVCARMNPSTFLLYIPINVSKYPTLPCPRPYLNMQIIFK